MDKQHKMKTAVVFFPLGYGGATSLLFVGIGWDMDLTSNAIHSLLKMGSDSTSTYINLILCFGILFFFDSTCLLLFMQKLFFYSLLICEIKSHGLN